MNSGRTDTEYIQKLFSAAEIIDRHDGNEGTVTKKLFEDILSYLYCLAKSDDDVSLRELLYINQVIGPYNSYFVFSDDIKTVKSFKKQLETVCPQICSDDFMKIVPQSYIAISRAEQRCILPIDKTPSSEIYYDLLILVGLKIITSDHEYDISEYRKWIDFMTAVNSYRKSIEVGE